MKMFRYVLACCCLVLPASSQQRAEVERDSDTKTSQEIVPVAASNDFREALRKATKMNFGECLPDSRLYPELFKREMKALAENAAPAGSIAGYSIYDSDPSWGGGILEEFRDGLAAADSIAPLSNEQAVLQFVPENFFSWKSDSGFQHALISLRQKQILFVRDEFKLRYALTDDGYNRVLLRCWVRMSRPDDLKDAKPFLETLASKKPMTIHEGFRRPGHHRDPQTEIERGVVTFGFFKFFKTGIADRELGGLRSLLAKEGAITEWRGRKACGGFFPDFCVTWMEDKERVVLHICLTCHEIRIEKGSTCLLYDLGDEFYDDLKQELEKFRKVGK